MSLSKYAALLAVVATYSCADGSAGGPESDRDGTEETPGGQNGSGADGGTNRTDSGTPGKPGFELPADGSLPKLKKVATERLGQLTDTVLNPTRPHGIEGTDLGVTFERDGKLVWLFGDSWTPGRTRQDQDSVATSTDTAIPDFRSQLPKLTWLTNGSNQFVAPTLGGVNLAGMNVPVEGIPVNAKTFVFFSTGYAQSGSSQTHSASVLAEMNGLDLSTLRVTHSVPSKKFINVSAVVDGNTAFIYGAGNPYRKSAIYLAKVDLDKLGDRSKWQYLQSGGTFGASEDAAQPVSSTACAGEISVRKWESVGLYLMTYNCQAPNDIQLRWARAPQGPWSEAIGIFSNATDGFGRLFHGAQTVNDDDGFSEPGRHLEPGGSYGPYLVPRYFSVEPDNVLSIVYALSSWNPYQVHLMRTRLALESNTTTPEPKGTGLAKARLVNGNFAQALNVGWQGGLAGFETFTEGSQQWVRSFTAAGGDAATGTIWQEFTVDATTSELRFKVRGGDARVALLHDGEVVRSTQARRANTPDVNVVWSLVEFRGEKVRLQIEDTLTAGWGFITVSPFELR